MDEDVRERLTLVYEQHLKNLTARLKQLYTIDNPLHENNVSGDEVIDVRHEYEVCRRLEEVYSVVERTGVPQGQTYEDYSSYMFHASKAKDVFSAKIEELERQHHAEITNINALMQMFRVELARLKKGDMGEQQAAARQG